MILRRVKTQPERNVHGYIDLIVTCADWFKHLQGSVIVIASYKRSEQITLLNRLDVVCEVQADENKNFIHEYMKSEKYKI